MSSTKITLGYLKFTQAAPVIRSVTLDPYVRYHECMKQGCSQKVVVIDGNQNIYIAFTYDLFQEI